MDKESLRPKSEEEAKTLEMHEKKIIGFMITGSLDYISGKNEADYNDVDENWEKRVLEWISDPDNAEDYKNYKNTLLRSINDNVDMSAFDEISRDPHYKSILGYFFGDHAIRRDSRFSLEMQEFILLYNRHYLPTDIAEKRADFLSSIRAKKSEEESDEYDRSMEVFCSNFFGKRWGYFKAFEDLEAKANTKDLVADAGDSIVNGGNVVTHANDDQSTYGLFDGPDWLDSTNAKKAMDAFSTYHDIKTADDVKRAFRFVNGTLRRNERSSNALFGKIVEEKGQKKLLYGGIGNDCIYVIRNGEAEQIVLDGEVKAIGQISPFDDEEQFDKNFGEHPLMDGDYVVMCSGGMSKNGEQDKNMVTETVTNARNCHNAAWQLAERILRNLDKAAIIVQVK